MEKRKILKSKKFLAVVSIALMLCLIGGMGTMTYSKYVTSKELGSQNATAAKWGYVITIDSSKLFGTDYTKGSTTNTATVVNKGAGVAVIATGDANVIAPGTSGSITITFSGASEVLAQLKISAKLDSEISYGDYKPIKWTINGGEFTNQTVEFGETDYGFTKTLDAGKSKINISYTISWEWAFEGNDTEDTLIGYKANGKSFNELPDVIKNSANSANYDAISTALEFSLTATVEQIQTK